MGLLSDIWWLSGVVFATPLAIVAVESLLREQWLLGTLFLALAGAMLLMPEYVRYRLAGGSEEGFLASLPVIGRLLG